MAAAAGGYPENVDVLPLAAIEARRGVGRTCAGRLRKEAAAPSAGWLRPGPPTTSRSPGT
jgi:hypothetical protein